MSAVRELIETLVSAGMEPAEAATMVTRAAMEMATPTKSAGAIRQQRYRERNKASQNVTPLRSDETSQGVTKRNESVTRDASISYKEEYLIKDKIDRKTRKRNVPLPESWRPPPRSIELARELGLDLAPIEERFRDYLKSTGRLYADYDAGFCNFVRNTPKFNGGQQRAAPAPVASNSIDWESQVSRFARGQAWSTRWYGPEPGQIGCRAPPEVLAKHGFGQVA